MRRLSWALEWVEQWAAEQGQREARAALRGVGVGSGRGGVGMELGEAERFVQAAEEDYAAMVRGYSALVTEAPAMNVTVAREVRADVLMAQQVLDLARSEEWRARQAQEERERAEEERERREQGPRGHDGWCDHCGAPAGVMAWGNVDLCPVCHARELRAAAQAGEGDGDGR